MPSADSFSSVELPHSSPSILVEDSEIQEIIQNCQSLLSSLSFKQQSFLEFFVAEYIQTVEENTYSTVLLTSHNSVDLKNCKKINSKTEFSHYECAHNSHNESIDLFDDFEVLAHIIDDHRPKTGGLN